MMPEEHGMPSPDSSNEDILRAVCRQYFREVELADARRVIEAGGTYEEALTSLAQAAQDDLRSSGERPHWFFTIPSGKVFVYRPGHGFPERPIYTVYASYLASQAFPVPEHREQTGAAAKLAPKRQLSFWAASELEGENASAERPTPRREKRARSKKESYVEGSISLAHRPPKDGWIAKDSGLGYLVEPTPSGSYWVSLIHLKSGREMAMVSSTALDHDRIRTWVTACARVTDWTQGIQAILSEQHETPKKQAWSRQLEAIWRDQRQVKRQLALF